MAVALHTWEAIIEPMDPLSIFHPIVREWFESRFAAPTEAQSLGWPAIAQGQHTLISAPTGSGKTLAAFLICIDRLFRAAMGGKLADHAHVVRLGGVRRGMSDKGPHTCLPGSFRMMQSLAAAAFRFWVGPPNPRSAFRHCATNV